MRITISGGKLYYFVNGDLVGSGSFTKPTADKFYIKSSGTVYLDELRVTTGSLSSTGSYNPSNAPYDTNKVLALPDNLTANTIYVQHNTPVANYRIGGVRPSNPSNGYFYIPLHADYTGGQPQFYVDGNWINVTAMVYNGTTAVNALGYQFSPMGANSDVINPENCSHNWTEKNRIDATCTESGSVQYVCSKCSKTKEETVTALDHDWQESSRTDATCTAAGSVISTCSRCQETKTTTIPALGGDHTWTESSRTEATATAPGSILYTCSVCGSTKTEEIPALGYDPDTCTHDWIENIADTVASTCTRDGVKSYVCSKCEKVKLETVPLLDHDWMVKIAITNQYDENGELVVVGFTIYECTRCQEQYKSVDGTAPPALRPGGSSITTPGGSSGDDGEEKEGFFGWLLRKAGELLGTIGDGIIGLLQAALGKIFDGLISLVTMAFEKLAQLVNLFGSFGDALGVLWTWLPEEIMLVLVAGVTVFVFVGLLKVFMK